jgi:deazaflavin-dependent oxidoreductase (nitroreductase family)
MTMSDVKPARSRAEMDLTLFGDSHVEAYRRSNGETGYIWNGAPILLLTTRGRKSREPKTSPLIFVQDGETIAIVASKGGAPDHPDWYKNLTVDPRVTVQIKGEVYEARARTAEGAERERLWPKAVAVWPQYADYQAATARKIPVVILDRA